MGHYARYNRRYEKVNEEHAPGEEARSRVMEEARLRIEESHKRLWVILVKE